MALAIIAAFHFHENNAVAGFGELIMPNDQMGASARPFSPGFRISAFDAPILVCGTTPL